MEPTGACDATDAGYQLRRHQTDREGWLRGRHLGSATTDSVYLHLILRSSALDKPKQSAAQLLGVGSSYNYHYFVDLKGLKTADQG